MSSVEQPVAAPSRVRWWMAWVIAGAIVLGGVILALRLGTRLTPLIDMTR